MIHKAHKIVFLLFTLNYLYTMCYGSGAQAHVSRQDDAQAHENYNACESIEDKKNSAINVVQRIKFPQDDKHIVSQDEKNMFAIFDSIRSQLQAYNKNFSTCRAHQDAQNAIKNANKIYAQKIYKERENYYVWGFAWLCKCIEPLLWPSEKQFEDYAAQCDMLYLNFYDKVCEIKDSIQQGTYDGSFNFAVHMKNKRMLETWQPCKSILSTENNTPFQQAERQRVSQEGLREVIKKKIKTLSCQSYHNKNFKKEPYLSIRSEENLKNMLNHIGGYDEKSCYKLQDNGIKKLFDRLT